MTVPTWAHVTALFDQLQDLPVDERERRLATLTAQEVALVSEVRALLAAHDEVGDRFLTPAAALLGWSESEPARVELQAGDLLGAYEVQRRVGEGGMGTVYEARRRDDTRQRVALKTVGRRARGADVISRFANERRILASLQHRNIAALYDAAVTESGIPYFIMEFVDGVPIDRYCDERKLAIDERLRLFRQVCGAVQHAHGRLVVHRDLKPDNILVADDGTVKLLDFGIAKLLGPTVITPLTAAGETPLTAAYASPEQIRGEEAGTATDVYSLGVVLTKLLTGATPFCDVTPVTRFYEAVSSSPAPAPSSLVTDRTATTVGVTPSKLAASLSGELDAIVLMALRKEPERRYVSVEALSLDIQHYLNGLPVAARPDTTFYRFRKFVQRQRMLVLGLAVACTAIIIGTSMALVERSSARKSAVRATRISEFLQDILGANTVFGGVPRRLSTERLSLREVLDSAAARLPAQFNDDAEARISLHALFGGAYYGEGEHARALVQYDSALAIAVREHGATSEEVASLLTLRAANISEVRPDSALPIVQRALMLHTQHGTPDTAAHVVLALRTLANIQSSTGHIAAAESTLNRVLRIERRRGAVAHHSIGLILGAIGMAQHNRGVFDSAETSMRAAVAAFDSTGVPSYELALQLYSLSTHLISKGKTADALPLLLRARALAQRTLPPGTPLIMQLGITLADVQSTLGDTASSHREARVALAMIPTLADGSAVQGFITQWWYARMLRREQSWRDAEAAARAQFQSGRVVAAAFPHYLSDSYWLLGAVLSDVGKYDEAAPLLTESVTIAESRLGATTPRVTRGRRDLAVLALRRGDRGIGEAMLAKLPSATADSARRMARRPVLH